jgi:hypothetical protein
MVAVLKRYIGELAPDDVISGERGCYYVLLPIKREQIGGGYFYYLKDARAFARKCIAEYVHLPIDD